MLADEIDAFGSSEWGAQHCADVMRGKCGSFFLSSFGLLK